MPYCSLAEDEHNPATIASDEGWKGSGIPDEGSRRLSALNLLTEFEELTKLPFHFQELHLTFRL